jgi:branched-chain amino acid aminotransferase
MACTKKYFLSGTQLLGTKNFDISEFENTTALYEVVKLINGKVLFFEDHINRLKHSAKLSGKTIPLSDSKISQSVKYLIRKNEVINGRLKFLFRYNNNEEPKFFAFFLNDITPEPEFYIKGVKTVFFEACRDTPGIKQINYQLRHNVKAYIAQKNAFEALLINEERNLTEGSKSNFFGISAGKIYTPPTRNILPGITRSFVLKICEEQNIPLSEEPIPAHSVSAFDSAFLSGTSISILPVSAIESIEFSTDNTILRKIIGAYSKIVSNYLKTKQSLLTF